MLNEYEKENVKAILSIQKKRGFAEDLDVDYKVPRSIVKGSSIDLDGNGTVLKTGITEDIDDRGNQDNRIKTLTDSFGFEQFRLVQTKI